MRRGSVGAWFPKDGGSRVTWSAPRRLPRSDDGRMATSTRNSGVVAASIISAWCLKRQEGRTLEPTGACNRRMLDAGRSTNLDRRLRAQGGSGAQGRSPAREGMAASLWLQVPDPTEACNRHTLNAGNSMNFDWRLRAQGGRETGAKPQQPVWCKALGLARLGQSPRIWRLGTKSHG